MTDQSQALTRRPAHDVKLSNPFPQRSTMHVEGTSLSGRRITVDYEIRNGLKFYKQEFIADAKPTVSRRTECAPQTKQTRAAAGADPRQASA